MADIDVQPRRPSIWPWIAGLVALALLVWLLGEMLGGGDDAAEAERVEQVGAQPPSPTGEPVRYTAV